MGLVFIGWKAGFFIVILMLGVMLGGNWVWACCVDGELINDCVFIE